MGEDSYRTTPFYSVGRAFSVDGEGCRCSYYEGCQLSCRRFNSQEGCRLVEFVYVVRCGPRAVTMLWDGAM